MKKIIGWFILAALFIGFIILMLHHIHWKALLFSVIAAVVVYGVAIFAMYLIFDDSK